MKKLFFTLIFTIFITSSAFATPFCIKEPLCIREPEEGVYVVKINTDEYKVRAHIVEDLMKVEDVYKNNNFKAVVNGGYFDFSNHKTVSYVTRAGNTILDPMDNEHLSENVALKPDLDLILNRSEFRMLDCGGKIQYDILKHFDTVKDGCKVVDSLQAGPMIYPEIKSEEEYFTRKNAEGKLVRNAIQVDQKKPRTAVAIKRNKVYFIFATRQHPMTLDDLYDFSKKQHFEKVLNLDGGGSTSFSTQDFDIRSERNNAQRRVKSFLVVEE